jgi:hypothetical protein
MADEVLVVEINDAVRNARAELTIEIHQRPGSAEKFVEALALGAIGLRRAREVARDELQGIDRNPDFEGHATAALRQDRSLQEMRNGFHELNRIWAILHDL